MDRVEAGATLLEVIVAAGIAAIAALLIWRAEPLGSRLALRTAAVGLISDLRSVQAKAIGERSPDRTYGIDLPVGGDRYTLFARTDQAVSPLVTRVLPPGVRIAYARFGGTDSSRLLFTGVSLYGAPSGGGTVTFTVRGGIRLCVRVRPATASTRISHVDCP